ncbi:hypothetical protein V1512DRAFT_213727, partial [Lipomyces arxii]|uniref:uncharacterized protein n=1 Tax=Lipomyces arxii TaxID=56418 RepID=UPI0034CF7902
MPDEEQRQTIIDGYTDDRHFGEIYTILKEGREVPAKLQHHIRHFKLQDGLLYFAITVGLDDTTMRICIPKGDVRIVYLENAHESSTAGHFGLYRTYLALARRAYWPRM